jgi:hypothetical protein
MPESAQPVVAVCTQKPTDSLGEGIMVNWQTPMARIAFSCDADCAASALFPKKTFVLLGFDAIATANVRSPLICIPSSALLGVFTGDAS